MVDIQDTARFGQFPGHGEGDGGIGIVGTEEAEEENWRGFRVEAVFHTSNISVFHNPDKRILS